MKSIVFSVKSASRRLLPHRLYTRLDEYYYYRLRPTYFALPDHWFHLRRRTFCKRMMIVVGTSHRVGSTWFYHMVRDLAHCQFGLDALPSGLRDPGGTLLLTPAGYAFLQRQQGHKIYKSHSLPPSTQAEAESACFLSIYRDPRDVVTSLSFYLAWLSEARGGHRGELCGLSPQQRIHWVLDQPTFLCELEAWFHTPFAHKVCYETLQQTPDHVLEEVANVLAITTTSKEIRKIVQEHSFALKSSKQSGDAEGDGPMRKGVVGDWRNYFNEACIEHFKTAKDGRWNRLLVEMGYERTLAWE